MDQRVVWILGAGGGVGGCVAHHLSNAGWTVVGSGRDPQRLAEMGNKIPGLSPLPLDARDPQQVEAAARVSANLKSWVPPLTPLTLL